MKVLYLTKKTVFYIYAKILLTSIMRRHAESIFTIFNKKLPFKKQDSNAWAGLFSYRK